MTAAQVHPDEAELVAHALGHEPRAATRHLLSCRACVEAAHFYRDLAAVAPLAVAPPTPCPDPLALATLVAPPPGLHRHLASCLDCALELEGLERMAAMPAPPRRLRPSRPAALAARLRALVTFDMPVPVVLHPRGPRAAAASPEFRAAMRDYRARRYPEACKALRQARARGDRSPALALYLGAALLRIGRHRSALPLLREAAGRRGSADGLWYLAQALLGLGQGGEALSALRAAARRPGLHRPAARALAERVAAVLGEGEA